VNFRNLPKTAYLHLYKYKQGPTIEWSGLCNVYFTAASKIGDLAYNPQASYNVKYQLWQKFSIATFANISAIR